MKRPIITEFLDDGIELEEAHEIYKMNPELWSYIQAQDKHIDYVESQLKERDLYISQLEGEIIDDKFNIQELQSQLEKERSDILKITNKNTPCFLRINKIRNIVKLKTNQL